MKAAYEHSLQVYSMPNCRRGRAFVFSAHWTHKHGDGEEHDETAPNHCFMVYPQRFRQTKQAVAHEVTYPLQNQEATPM
jgi:hypothetical protein